MRKILLTMFLVLLLAVPVQAQVSSGGVSISGVARLWLATKTETLSGAKTLTVADAQYQKFDADGSDRDVTLPAEEISGGLPFWILNASDGAGETLTIKDDTPATLGVLEPGEMGLFVCNGTEWVGGKMYPDGGPLIVDGVANTVTIAGDLSANTITANTAIATDGAGDADIGTEALYFQKLFLESEISFEGATDNDYQTTLSVTNTTSSDKTITLQDADGIVAMDTSAVTDLEGTGLSIGTGTLNWASALTGLSDVTITSAAVDEGLMYNGSEWVNRNLDLTGAGGGIDFYMDDSELIGTGANNDNVMYELEKFPISTSEDQDDIICTSADSPVLGEAYLYNTALGATSIEAGEWHFHTYAAVNLTTAGRVSSLTRVFYHVVVDAGTVTTTGGSGTSRTATVSGTTPFVSGDADGANVDAGYLQTPQGLYQITGFTSSSVVTILTPTNYSDESGVAFSTWKNEFSTSTGTIIGTDPSFILYDTKTVQPAITIVATDKLGEIVFAVCNNNTTVSWTHNGTDRYSNFHTPIATRHNDLPGLDAGDYQHLTAAEHTGSGTGVFARIDSPVFTTKIDISDGNITSVGDIELDTISNEDGTLAMTIAASTGVVTLAATASGSIDGNAATVTNATLTTAITVSGQDVTIAGVTQANTITLNESITVGDGYDFTLTATGAAGTILLDKQTLEIEGEGTATQLTKIVNANNAAATLTIEGTSATVNQDTTTDASPQFAGLDVSDGNITSIGDIELDTISNEDGSPAMTIAASTGDVTLAGDLIFTSGKLLGTTGDPDLMTIADDTLTIAGAHLATTYTATAIEDPVVFYDALDADDTDWYTGTNADADADSDDVYEIRTNSTPGNGVLASIDPTSGSEVFRHHAPTVHRYGDDVTHGGYLRVVYSATSGTLTGATDKIELDIPSGSYILMCQLHVKTTVSDDGGNDTWSSELNDTGQVEVISTGSAAAQNTNINHRADADTAWTITDAETDILLTPNGGSFDAGEIEAHCLVELFDTWDAD